MVFCRLNYLQKMRNKRKLLIEQLDQKLQPFSESRKVLVPERGWINTIRTALNMTMAQLGTKLNITRQGVKRIEDSEANGTITLNSLKDVAKALDLKLVYALIPKNETIDDLIQKKADKLAQKIVIRANQNMKLEDQGIGDDKIAKTIKELASEIKREMRKSLWD
ncbi:putative DNA-binding mobile mystery protein A [Maribacter spongiicola]|uniref:Putative DNA-binding mobile mystery protein A n=2 Tax=Maribacter spongiicola TaxID=1206753 RepID=A0A4R7K7A2_9FLAO|nr:putative DNA-binding mobile mystery protein A [Maribacter spongiicola]